MIAYVEGGGSLERFFLIFSRSLSGVGRMSHMEGVVFLVVWVFKVTCREFGEGFVGRPLTRSCICQVLPSLF